MKKLVKYSEFINEKYTEDPEYKIKSYFDQLIKDINKWFTEGAFASSGAVLGKITPSVLNDIEKNLIFEFSDEENYYQVYVIISLEDVTDEEMNDCYVKVKKYTNEGELLKTLGEDVLIKDLNEDKIVGLFSRLSETEGSDATEKGKTSETEEETPEIPETEEETPGDLGA
jgi:hypothetical protein